MEHGPAANIDSGGLLGAEGQRAPVTASHMVIAALKISRLVEQVGRLAHAAVERLGQGCTGSASRVRSAMVAPGERAMFRGVYDLCVAEMQLNRDLAASLVLAASALAQIAELAAEIAQLVIFAVTGRRRPARAVQ